MSEAEEIHPSHKKMGEADLEIVESESKDVVQDQIIIAPEIMNLILKRLDFRSLKKVRLVCKSWLSEAQAHMERRGNVQLCSRTTQEFLETHQNGLPDLPKPFRSADVKFYDSSCRYPEERIVQLSSLSPPLAITRLSPVTIPLNLSLPLIIQSSSHLEYLMISARDCEAEYLPPLDSKQIFPKLGHVNVHTQNSVDGTDRRIHFPSIVSWIVKASPNLDTFETWGRDPETTEELAGQLLQKVDIKNVKSLLSFHCCLEGAALEHFLSIPFDRLEKLRMRLQHFDALQQSDDILIATIAKCTRTLRVLDLSVFNGELEEIAFPVIPNLEELTLNSFPSLTNFLSDHFPSLQVLNVLRILVDVLGDSWRELNPFLSLKTLRAKHLMFIDAYDDDDPERQVVQFFEKFPALERIQLSSTFVLFCCELIANAEPRFSSLLAGIKHLELRESTVEGLDPGFMALAVLKGLETLTMVSRSGESGVLFVPFHELPNLRVVKFPWSWGVCPSTTMDKLLALARGVDKVVVTNCCHLRMIDPLYKHFLHVFFESAPMSECGCKEKNNMELWGWCH